MYKGYYTTNNKNNNNRKISNKNKNKNKKNRNNNYNIYNIYNKNNSDSDSDSDINLNTLVFDNEKKKDWISMMDKLDKEYSHIIDLKKELDNSLEKMVDVTTIKKYQVIVPRKQRISDPHYHRMSKAKEEYYIIHRGSFYKICDKLRGYICRTKEQHKYRYDEEDLNNIETEDSIERINSYI